MAGQVASLGEEDLDGAAAGAVGGALLDGPKDTSRASTGAVQVQVQVKAPKSGQIQDSFEDENTPSLEAVRGVCWTSFYCCAMVSGVGHCWGRGGRSCV